ncbi:DUF6904 family protein [Pedobacter foliorum]|uniref:DUF6904 family protein n=1 Tax=Pedobacter foliorum TaxID=2739058 RepID=UPI0015638548|nr:hypothetical protein [Pedobacter foliorum]NRF41451.1 hypothetical protein [Pedobacter foliorum]
MLTGCLFNNGAGVKILGDTSDLISLHRTVHKVTMLIVDYELEDTEVSTLLVDFLECLEKAYTGVALREEKIIHKNRVVCYGLEISWIELLMVSNLLRYLADYVVTDELDEINMRLLEYITRKTIATVSEEEYQIISNYLGKRFSYVNIKQFIKSFSCNVQNLRKRSVYGNLNCLMAIVDIKHDEKH